MIQITKWIAPDEETWYKGTFITNLEWLNIQVKLLLLRLMKKEIKQYLGRE